MHSHSISPLRRALAGLTVVAAGLATLAVPAAQAAETGSAPAFVATIGGSGRAEVYPSGLETTPDGGVVLADTGNDRVEKYDAAGNLAWVHGTHGFGPQGINNPRDVGVDAAGNVYVADTGNTSIVKLSPSGAYLGRYRGPAGDQIKSPIGVTVANGQVLVADAGSLKIRVFSLAGVQQRTVGQQGCAFSQIRDVTADSAGNFYVANYTKNNVLKLSPTGECLATFGSVGTTEGKWKNPYGVAVANDPQLGEVLYVADSNNNRVQVLSLTGQFIASVGSAGEYGDQGKFDELRRVAVAADGDIWAADLWGFTAQRFNRVAGSWTYAQTIGSNPPGTTENALFNQPNGIDNDADGNLVVVDRMHHRLARFDRQGRLLSLCGERGSTSLGFNWPADVAVDESTGQLWVADTHQNRLQVTTPTCSSSTPIGKQGAALGQFKFPSGIEIRLSDRIAFVADSGNNRLVSYNVASRAPIASATLGLKNPQGVAVDPASGDVFIADKANSRVVRVASANGSSFSVVRTYTGLNKPEGVSIDGQGRLFVAETAANRLTILDAATGSQLGTTTGPDGMNEPQSVHVSGGVVYVSDTFNDRVQTFAYGGDPVAPEATITEPGAGQSLPAGAVALKGRARDNKDLAGVDVAIRDTVSGTWWNAASQTWGASTVWSAATLTDSASRDSAWTASFDEPASSGSGSYEARARARDTQGNVTSTPATVSFTVAATVKTDSAAPETALTAPVQGTTVPAGKVAVTGTATDDVALDAVQVAIRDRVSLKWWNASTGTFGTPLVRSPAVLASPGGKSSTFSFSFDTAAAASVGGSGSYLANVRAVDKAGKTDASPATTFWTTGPARDLTYVRDFAEPGLADLTPVDVVVSPTHYYAVDVARYRIARVDRSTGLVDATVGGGRGSAPGELMAARSIARASNGDIYVADTPNNRVSVYTSDLTYKGAFGSQGTGPGQFTQVYGLAIGTGQGSSGPEEIVYTIDGGGDGSNLGRISRWTLGGDYLGSFAASTTLNQPRMAEVHPVTHDLWVVNARNREVVVFDTAGVEQNRFGNGGTGNGEFDGDPRGIAINPAGDRIYVSDEGNHRVQVFDDTGSYLEQIAPAGERFLVDVRGLDVAEDGTVVVSDEWNYSLKEFAPDGTPLRKLFGATPAVGGVNTPRGLALDSQNRVFVSDWWNQRVQRWNADGTGALAFGYRGTTADPGSINFAWDVAVQPGTDRVFVANRESHEIEVFTNDGTFVTRWGSRGSNDGELEFPQGVAFAPNGDLVVTDSGNDRVQRFSIAGSGQGTWVATYGGLGTGAGEFSVPTGITVAPDGTIWVADTDNNRIQKRDPATGAWTAYDQPTGSATTYRRPWGVTANADGTVWVTDSGRGRVVLVKADGSRDFEATGEQMGAGPLAQPFDTLPLPNGNLLISDAFNNRIIEVER